MNLLRPVHFQQFSTRRSHRAEHHGEMRRLVGAQIIHCLTEITGRLGPVIILLDEAWVQMRPIRLDGLRFNRGKLGLRQRSVVHQALAFQQYVHTRQQGQVLKHGLGGYRFWRGDDGAKREAGGPGQRWH